VFSDRKAPFHVECKKHEGWNLADLVTGIRGLDSNCTNSIEQWWQQAIKDCPTKKLPVLVFAKNRQPPLVMMFGGDFYRVFDSELGILFKHFLVETEAPGDRTRIVLTLDDFVKYVRPPERSPRHNVWKQGVG
jgi:hypothetical protein